MVLLVAFFLLKNGVFSIEKNSFPTIIGNLQSKENKYMKWFFRIMMLLLILGLLSILGSWYLFYSTTPNYNGNLEVEGISAPVEILYDDYGIPHIYGKTEEDAYFGLGYAAAQDRIFLMDMMRYSAAGRLSEIFGEKTHKVDRYFRTLGMDKLSKELSQKHLVGQSQPYQKAVHAYLKGVNHFIANGTYPPEYSLLNIPKEPFTTKDIYNVIGIMTLGFAEGFREDPLITKFLQDLGPEYLNDFDIQGDTSLLTNFNYSSISAEEPIGYFLHQLLEDLPIALFHGSNSWVVSGQKSITGKPIICNDTHIGLRQPAIWYEAHLEAPDLSFYGNFLAGCPFGIIGNTRSCGWGITMLENDDIDFYREKLNPEDSSQVWENDHWAPMKHRQEIIMVKGEKTDTLDVWETRHGPVVNSVMPEIGNRETQPVSLWWTLYHSNSNSIEGLYKLSKVENLQNMTDALKQIAAPGLNFTYADIEGNIAWWAVAHLLKRPMHSDGKVILDGASGNDEPLGFYDFSENPHSVNPPSGFVYSANHQVKMPQTGEIYPGYYTPDWRAKRIVDLLEEKEKWSKEELNEMFLDDASPGAKSIVSTLLPLIDPKDELQENALEILGKWDGTHGVEQIAPVVYFQWLNNILKKTIEDEIGEESFNILHSNLLMRRSYKRLIENKHSVWWDNVHTKDQKETRKETVTLAFESAIRQLQKQLGNELNDWQWGKMHTVTHPHPMAAQAPFDKIFNVGPFPVSGGNVVINNLGFKYDTIGKFEVVHGPAMRVLTDLSDLNQNWGILPTGQSGNLNSPHYDDQALMYNKGEMRPRWMNRADIERVSKNKLLLNPISSQ